MMATLYRRSGRWCFEVAKISWAERRIASALFGGLHPYQPGSYFSFPLYFSIILVPVTFLPAIVAAGVSFYFDTIPTIVTAAVSSFFLPSK